MINTLLFFVLQGHGDVVNRGLPQTVPLQFYTTFVYGFGRESEESEGPEDPRDQWWDAKQGDVTIGAPKQPGKVEVSKAARAAWGMMWWGQRLNQFDWIGHADDLVNLTLVAPNRGGHPAAKCWVAPLRWADYGTRSGDAETAYWYLRWLKEWPEASQAESMRARIAAVMADVESDGASGWHVERFLSELAGTPALDASLSERAGAVLARTTFKAESSSELLQLAKRQGQVDDAPVRLMRHAARTHSKHLFEAGVAALKAPLSLLNEPTLEANGVRVPDGVRQGSMAARDAKGRVSVPADWTFERYEGQLLANFAEVTAEFGGYYKDPTGWAVGIDGCRATENGPVSTISSNPFPYSGEHKVDIVEPGKPRTTVDVTVLPSISRMEVEDGKIIAIPGALRQSGKMTLSGTFTLKGSKWSRKAEVGLRGFEAPWPKGVRSGRFSFEGHINGKRVWFGPFELKQRLD